MKTRDSFKRKAAAAMAVVMLAGMLAGCGNGNEKPEGESGGGSVSSQAEDTKSSSAEQNDSSQDDSSQDGISAGIGDPGNITIDFLRFNFPTLQDDFNEFGKTSPVYEELVKQTGVEFNMIGLDADQANIRITSGDLGDLISIETLENYEALVDSEQLLPLNDLIDEYGPNIKNNFPKRYEWALEQGDGTAYILPVQAGGEGYQATNGRYLYTIRWDLYKQLGYPEIKNPDDLVKVMSDMIALQPTTPEGKKVYGASFYLTDTSFSAFVSNFEGTYGMKWKVGRHAWEDIQNHRMVYMSEENSPFWMAADYYHKAYLAGILDPDCFTQQSADFDARIDSGELICPMFYNTGWEEEQRKAGLIGEDEAVGYANIPVDGCMFYQSPDDVPDSKGWGCARALAIPKTCKDPERIIKLIDYCFSDEGSRMLMSGVEGLHWDYVDGVPTYNEETVKIIAENGEACRNSGIWASCLAWMAGTVGGQLLSDGYHAAIQRDQDYMSRVEYSPVLKDFCEYYGVSWPNEIFKKRKEEGRMYDLEESMAVTLVPTEETQRIDALCVQICLDAIPKLVTAADDAAFEAVKAETLAALKDAGCEKAAEYYRQEYDRQYAELKAAEN